MKLVDRLLDGRKLKWAIYGTLATAFSAWASKQFGMSEAMQSQVVLSVSGLFGAGLTAQGIADVVTKGATSEFVQKLKANKEQPK